MTPKETKLLGRWLRGVTVVLFVSCWTMYLALMLREPEVVPELPKAVIALAASLMIYLHGIVVGVDMWDAQRKSG